VNLSDGHCDRAASFRIEITLETILIATAIRRRRGRKNDRGIDPARRSRKIVDAVFAEIAAVAAKGDEVSLNGSGKFKVKASAAREGRNPATGATIAIASVEEADICCRQGGQG
jgi:nucleoid DNA-binding protein